MANIQGTASGKTSPALSPPTEETTSKLSSKQLSELKKKGSRCLRLRITDGRKRTYIWETDLAWLTEFSTLNTGASPNVAQESTLSEILLAEVPEKYYLSPKACLGILRRASARGKELPEVLKKALERQAGGLTLANGLGHGLRVERIMPCFMGLLFVIIGNYLPKTKQSYTMGIRIPWTLNSEENWNRTHRLAGFLWVLGGLWFIVMSFIGWSLPAFLAPLLVMVLVPVVYSYVLYKKGI